MKNQVRHFNSGWRQRIASVRHRCICYFIGGGGILFLGLFVLIFGLPILLIEFIERQIKRKKQGLTTCSASIQVDEELREKIIYELVSREFYMRDFSDEKAAAKHLGISQDVLIFVIRKMEACSLHDFIYEMRVEEVKDHLRKHPHAPLEKVAQACGFNSEAHLLWHFYKHEECSPKQWMTQHTL